MQPSTMPPLTSDVQTISHDGFQLFEATPGKRVVFLPDTPTFTIVAASEDMRQFVGRTREQMVGKSVFEAFPANPETADATGHSNLRNSLEYVVRHKASHQMEKQRYDVAAEDGSFKEIYWQNTSTPVLNEEGSVTCIIHTAEDITEKVKAAKLQERLKGLEQAYGLFMQAPFAVHILTGPDLIIELANPPTLELWGKTEDLTGKCFLHVLPELKGQGYDVMMHEVMQSGQPRFFYEVPLALNRPGKEPVGYFNFIYQPYYNEGSSTAESVLIIANEVTEQVLARKQAEAGKQLLQSMVMQSPSGICIVSGSPLRADVVNDAFLLVSGKSRKAFETTPYWEVLNEAAPTYAPILDAVFATGEAFEVAEEMVPLVRNGQEVITYLNFLYQPLKGTTGITEKVMVFVTDVTEQKLARQAIEKSEQDLRNLILKAPVGICIVSGNPVMVEIANDIFLEVIGKSREAFVPTPYWEVNSEAAVYYEPILKNVFATGTPYHAQEHEIMLIRNGKEEIVHVSFVYDPIVEADGVVRKVMILAMDVTTQVLARHKTQQNEKQLETALEQMRLSKEAAELGIFDLDLEQNTMHWDDRCRILFGISHHHPVTYEKDFVGGLHTDDKDRILEVIGKSFIKSVSNGDYDVEYRTVGAEDGLVRWVRAKGKVYFNEEEKPVRFIGSVLDITEQINALQKIEEVVAQRTKELAEANESLQAINKELQRSNQNLEEFAHAASHDLKEPIRKITFFAHQLKDQLTTHLKEAELRSFGRIENATERMGALIDDLLLYSHVSQRPHETEAIDLNVKVQRVLEDLELDIEEKKAVVHVEKLPVVQGYRRQLQQLFQNLISNALKYSKADVPPVIDISASMVTESNRRYHVITVKDNGIGFDQQYADKIFQMFARLHGKHEYSGTGVGLSIVKKVVENHHGHIQVQSLPGHGSTFTIYLPVK